MSQLIRRLDAGRPGVAEELLSHVYGELRDIAERLFVRQPNGHTLQPTVLVHEAWLKLAGHDAGWETRGHFFAVAARAMRQVLADHARARRTDKRGRGWRRVTFCDQTAPQEQDCDLIDLDDALRQLAAANERHARVAELRLFAGLTVDEVAAVLGVTPRTVQLDWRATRAWLRHALDGPKTL